MQTSIVYLVPMVLECPCIGSSQLCDVYSTLMTMNIKGKKGISFLCNLYYGILKNPICVEKNKQRVKSDARFREKYCCTFSKKSLERVG
jgi:hypothetical protein